MPANGTWPCATCGTLVYLYEVRGDGCVDCPKVVPGVTPDPVDEPPTGAPILPPRDGRPTSLPYPEVRR